MKNKCIIVDDEPLAQALMKDHVSKLEDFELVGVCSNAMEAMTALHNNKIDLMFLDIHMPQISGIEFLKILKNPPKVIFTTAYREHALEGFELDVVDYLLKPITFERFLKSVNKFYQTKSDTVQVNEGIKGPDDSYIYVKENKMVKKIPLKDILYIEGYSEYVRIYMPDKRIITKASLTELENKLPADDFLRIHKSYIVSVPHITAFSASIIEIKEKELPIGRNYKNSVMKALNYNGSVNVT
ncbi:LytR/AlgR family response regulator transcription factor [Saccharicrinis sp. FJH62]|uniref:LytR/AlgR family response regulator transcription factor n=1 Tax=Saccharicrinis sp. FJH62 TaxID=3344657 RepID=UPI0035D4027A